MNTYQLFNCMHALHHHVQANQGHKIHLLVYHCSNQGLHRCEGGVEELMRELVRTLKTETAQPRMFALVAIECSFSCPIHSLTPNAPSSITVVATCSDIQANYAQKSGHYAMLLCFLQLATMLWVGYCYAPLTGYHAWNLISN